MRILKNFFDAFMGLALRLILGSFLFGVAMILLVIHIESTMERKMPPENWNWKNTAWLILALAVLTFNAIVARREHGQRCKAVSQVVDYCGPRHRRP